MLHYLKLVVPTRIELVMVDYQSTVIPFNYRTMVVPLGIEPSSSVLQTAAMTTFAKAPNWWRIADSNCLLMLAKHMCSQLAPIPLKLAGPERIELPLAGS